MAVKIGLPLWIGNLISKDNLLANILDAKNSGIDFFEVSLDYPIPFKNSNKFFELLEKIKENGLGISIHAPWRDMVFATPYEELGTAVVDTIYKSIYAVKEFVSEKYVNVHPFTMQKIDILDNRKDVIKSLRRNTELLISKLKTIDEEFVLLLENVGKGFGSEPSDLLEAVEGLENVGLCLDIGHLAHHYCRDLKNYYESFYNYLKEVTQILSGQNVLVIHLHDVDEKCREHLLIGEGKLAFKQIYKIISPLKPRYVVYEVFRSTKEKITFKSILRNIGEQITWVRIYLH